MAKTILVIDDDPEILNILSITLTKEQFDVITALDGREGLHKAYVHHPDLVVLDIMMPDMDGWQTCQRLRYVCDVPILMLTARNEQSNILKGLSLGADDYLTKPCSFEELNARIHACLRRATPQSTESWQTRYDDGVLFIDFDEGTVIRDGEQIELTPTESQILLYLASKPGHVFSHQELLTRVWGDEHKDDTGYLSVYIRYLRRKVEQDPNNPIYIRTRWGMGYYFSARKPANSD
jgi:two-component system KDP operon response regulator KdpE